MGLQQLTLIDTKTLQDLSSVYNRHMALPPSIYSTCMVHSGSESIGQELLKRCLQRCQIAKITTLASKAGSAVPRQGKRGRLSPGLAGFPRCNHQLVWSSQLREGGKIQEWERVGAPGEEVTAAAWFGL